MCHRYPPTVTRDAEDDLVFSQPASAPDDWCGEHKPKDSVMPDGLTRDSVALYADKDDMTRSTADKPKEGSDE